MYISVLPFRSLSLLECMALSLSGSSHIVLPLRRADIRKHPVYVRAVVEGATHASAVAAAAAATPETAAQIAMGFDITKGLEMQETPDHLVKGEVNPPDAEGKTMAVNLALYSLSPYNCW